MPQQVVDISSSRSPKKSSGKPAPKPGPKPAVLVAVGLGLVLAIFILLRFVFFRAADGNQAVPYDSAKQRSVPGANGGAAGGTKSQGSNVPRGLPGDGG